MRNVKVHQQYGNVVAANVRPRQKTELQLAEGWWSLSTLSSVPYVRVTGPKGQQKEFSWGELIHIPAGTSAQVENASYHVGDIVLSGGQDFASLPARVTVPVSFLDTTTGTILTAPPPVGVPTFVRTAWKCDTRRARRAYLMLTIQAIIDFDFTVRGYAEQRSHRTVNTIVPTAGQPAGVGYASIATLNAATAGFMLPLGYNAAVNPNGSEPFALLDSADVTFSITRDTDATWSDIGAYYVLEY